MTAIHLDIDLIYDKWYESIIGARIVQRLPYLAEKYGDPVILSRRSSHGKTHLRIEFPKEIDDFNIFLTRALLCDDPKRILMDLKRYSIYGSSEVDRLWDAKFTIGVDGVKKMLAGEPEIIGYGELREKVIAYLSGLNKDKYKMLLDSILEGRID